MQQQISKYLLSVIFVGVLGVLFVPIVMNSKFFFPFIVPKDILFRIIVEIIFFAYLALASLDSHYRPRFTMLTWSVIAFFGISLGAMIAGIGWYSSFWGNYERMGGIFHHLHLVLYFIVLINVFRRDRDWHGFLTFSIFMGMLMSFMAFAQYLQVDFLLGSSGGQRLTATMGNPTFFAAYLLFNLFFLGYFLAKENRFAIRLYAISFLVLDVYLVLAALLSRMAGASDWGLFNLLKAPVLNQAWEYPTFFWGFVIYQACIAAVWFFRERRYALSALLVATLFFQFFIFFNTQTRGALLGLLAGIIFLTAVSLLVRAHKPVKLLAAGVLIAAVLAPVVIYSSRSMPWVKNNGTLNRLASISFKDVTTESRLLTWGASWKGWSENPKTFLVGYGPENYYYVFNKYFPTKIYRDNGSQIWFDRPHNIIFDVGVTTGALGLAAYVAILGLATYGLWLVYRRTSSLSSSFLLIALIIAYVIQNLFVFDTLNTEVLWYLLLGFIVFLVSRNSETKTQEGALKNPNYVYLGTLGVVLLFAVFVVNIGTARANNFLFKAIKETSISSTSEVKTLFHRAIDESWTGRYEARQQYSLVAQGLARKAQLTSADTELIHDAADELEKSVTEEPTNIRHHLWLAGYLDSMAQVDPTFPKKAIDILEKNIDLSPTRPQVYFELGQGYALIGNISKATEYFQKGVDLAPMVIDSHQTLLLFSILTKQTDLTDKEFRAMADLGWKPGPAEYRLLIDAYSRVNQFDRMSALMEKLVVIEPTAANYARLAAIYAEMGDKQKAREAVEKAIAIDPSIKEEAQKFLDSLK